MASKYTGDVSFLKRGMKDWIIDYNNHHPDNPINREPMDFSNDNWGEGAKTNFWRMHNRVSGLEYEAYPTWQLYNLCYPSQPG